MINIKDIFGSIKEFIFGEEGEVREISYYPEDVNEIPDKYKRQIGSLKAKASFFERQLNLSEQEKKALQEKLDGEYEIEDKIEDRRNLLEKRKAEKILPLNKIPIDTRVFSSDLRLLGYFKGFSVDEKKATLGVLISTEQNGKDTYEVWRAESIRRLIRAPERIKSQLENGILVLTRTWDGDFAPEIFDEIPIPIEKKVAEEMYA